MWFGVHYIVISGGLFELPLMCPLGTVQKRGDIVGKVVRCSGSCAGSKGRFDALGHRDTFRGMTEPAPYRRWRVVIR